MNMKKEKCLTCKKEFIPNKNQKLCSDRCKYIRKKLMDKKFLPSKEQRKIYRIKYRKHTANYIKNKRRTDINFRIKQYLGTRIWFALKGISKSKSTMKLLGCNIDLLRLYLQSKFQPGMSFSNYGKWHIDHIIPCTRFDLIKVSEQKKCFHYTNLQPLWAEDNIRKSDNIIN